MDWKVGLPNLLICIEMAIFSILHLWAFAWQAYSVEATDFYESGKVTYKGGRWGIKALLNALNPLDLLKAVSRGFRWLFVGRKNRTLDPSYQVPFEQIDIDQEGRVPPNATNLTAYEGAGPLMAGGRTSPDEEGAVLLSHPQPNPKNEPGLAPSGYDDEHRSRFYTSNHARLSDSSLLDPMTTSHSPYDDTYNNPYMVPFAKGDLHHHNRHPSDPMDHQGTGVTNRLYHPNGPARA